MKRIIISLTVGLVLTIGTAGESSAQTQTIELQSESAFIGFGCCMTNTGWCCAIGSAAECACSVSAEIFENLPQSGPYLGNTLEEALQGMENALSDESGEDAEVKQHLKLLAVEH